MLRAMLLPKRRTITTAGMLCTVLTLTACTGGAPRVSTPPATPAVTASASAPTASTSAPSPSPSSSGSAAEQRFVATIQRATPDLAALPPATLLALGRQSCAGLRSGQDVGQVATGLSRSESAPGLSESDVVFLLGGATAILCPQYRDRLDDDG